MKRHQSQLSLLIIFFCSFLFVACGPKNKINLTDKSGLYKDGLKDGCTTAEGNYSKDRDAFNHFADYHEGWFHGRQYCEYYKRADLKF